MKLARKTFRGLIWGLLIGTLVLGVGGRIVMRILSLVVHKEPGFTFGGTLEVIAFGALIGVPSGLVYAFANKYGFVTNGIILALVCRENQLNRGER